MTKGRGCRWNLGFAKVPPMAHNPQASQAPHGQPDPAANTQMFRAFVDEGTPAAPASPEPSKFRLGVVAGVVAVVAVVAVVVWLAVG